MRKMFLLFAIGLTLTGCSFGSTSTESTEVTEETADYKETSSQGIIIKTQKDIDKLKNNMYYVVHDDVYYPLYYGQGNCIDSVSYDDYADQNRVQFFTINDLDEIPTLYEGDKLMYYSTDTLLPYIMWERFYDNGYTIGLTNIKLNIADKAYVDFEDDNNDIGPILTNNEDELFSLNSEQGNQLLLDKISGTDIIPDFIDHGIIKGLKKDAPYDLDVYSGSIYKHITTNAYFKAMFAFELFASIEYTPLQDYLYEVAIPSYLTTGYYNIDNMGFLRYVKGTEFDDSTDFNVPLLFASKEDDYETTTETKTEEGETTEEVTTESETLTQEPFSPACFSAYEPINKFHNNIPGTLGYTPENANSEVVDSGTGMRVETEIRESVIKEFPLHLPEASCKIKITSDEKTGALVLIYPDGTEKKGTYDYINKEYVIETSGKNEDVILRVNGFFKGYEIELTNAVVNANAPETPSEETPSEEVSSTEISETTPVE